MDEKPPRNLKAMLSEAKDASELMVDLGYAALFFDNVAMAEEVMDLEERLDGLVHEMREVCILAARSPHDAEQMSSVLHVISSIERIGNAAVDIARIVIHRLGIPAALVADLAAADEVSHRVRVRDSSDLAGRSLADVELPVEVGMRERLEVWVLRGAAEQIDPSPLRGLLHLGSAAEQLGDSAQQMVWLVEQGEEMHPVLGLALGDSDEVIARVPVGAGSSLEGKTLREAKLELETGTYLLAIRRAGRYIYRPRGLVRLEAGDELIAIGPDDGRDRLAELAGFRVLEDDDTGQIELVRTLDAG